MKKIFLVAVATVCGFLSANAQVAFHPRVEVAGNFSKSVFKVSELSVNSSIKPGFRAGAAVEIQFGETGLFVAPGIGYKMEGGKFEMDKRLSSVSMNPTLHYLTVPVDLGLRVDLGAVALSVEAGPYFAFTPKATIDLKYNNMSQSYDLLKNKDIKRYDIGIGASTAVEFKGFFVRLGTDLGLLDISKNSDIELLGEAMKGIKMNNASFYAGVGFRF